MVFRLGLEKIVKHRVEKEVGSTGVSFRYNIDQFLIPKRGEKCEISGQPESRKLHGTETVTALSFADDLKALTSGPEEVEKILDILNKNVGGGGSVYVSFGKTYTQEWPAGNEELQYTDESLFSVDGNKIGNLTKFKARGQNIDNTNPEGYIRGTG